MEPGRPHDARACDGALVRAFGFLGKRWNGVLIATLTAGPSSFTELRRAVAGISDSVLSERLGELTRAGLVIRTVDAGPPVSVEYRLAPAGQAILPAMDALTAWASENLPVTAEDAASVSASSAGAASVNPPVAAPAAAPVAAAAER